MERSRFKKKSVSPSDNRITVIIAIIFLLGGILLYKLFSVQVVDKDLYVALAANQQEVESLLEPDRGRIFMSDTKTKAGGGQDYPLATNKEFGLIYARPDDIDDASSTAAKLYEAFDRERVEKEVDELIAVDPLFSALASTSAPAGPEVEEKLAFREIKRTAEIMSRRQAILDGYFGLLSLKGDPFVPLVSKVEKEIVEGFLSAETAGIDVVWETYRYYPENDIGSHLAGFVGYQGEEKKGLYGLEGFFDDELTGASGHLKTDKGPDGRIVIATDREYQKPIDGSDLYLTIERAIQFYACRRLNEAAASHGAEGGTVIVMQPETGAILAMCSWPDFDPNRYEEAEDIDLFNNPATYGQYEPGSIFKPITMAAAIDSGQVGPQTTYFDKGYAEITGWPKPIKNSDYETFGGHGQASMTDVLTLSLNTGSIFAMQKTGDRVFADYVKKFGFGEKTGIELETEQSGQIRSLLKDNIRPIEAATASFGQGITVTPLQMITAFAAIANGGILMKPYIVREIRHADGSGIITQPRQVLRVISERTALLLTGMMVNVVEEGHAKKAIVDGYYLAGKTGTAQVSDLERGGYGERTIHTFVGFGPVDDPAFVILVKLDHPKDVQFAASSAAPLFSDFARFVLQYYEIPKSR